MRRDGECIVIETTTDGVIAADAAAISTGDGLVEMYRNLDETEVPKTMGKWASADVISGLKDIKNMGLTVHGYLDANAAGVYLHFLGIES
ncbi:MAG TPA: hypothetical protein VMR34_01465 [Candidatus Saccharimonadales bacterium]|nr:hypothetical protein [Candidatus Saccharimonadales bacterium]